jgi:putative addiction module component (TIGR02574 family)
MNRRDEENAKRLLDWHNAADLTNDERRIIESRLEAHRQNPDAAIPWDDVEARLVTRFGS